MSKRKVEVDDLEYGMYIAELDRPWVGSPFLFQGFMLEEEEDLNKLQDYCKFVWVDEERSRDDDRTIRRSVNPQPQAKARMSRSEWSKVSDEERKIDFEKEMEKAVELRTRTRGYIDGLFKDIRMGTALDTETAKTVVNEMVESISEDASAALWLTNLKNAHEYTAQHCINVSVLSILLSDHLGFTKDQIKLIGLGAMLHDVGKMYTPVEILDKPGPLTPEEWEIMKRHPSDGYKIMKETGEIPEPSLQIIRYHHERISGNGYPDGLKGDQVSTAILISAIADVYDALTSDRIYHKGIPANKALNAMYRLAPTDFGKNLVEEFIKCIGIYPVGSVVELASGDVGVVMTSDPGNKLRPVVMLMRDSAGNAIQPPRFVSLAYLETADKARDWSVKRVVDPKAVGLSLQEIAQNELIKGGSEAFHI